MTFADIPAGARVFLDANALIYHFTSHPDFGASCSDLLDRVDHAEVEGFTAVHVVSEMAHRLMTIEASQLFGWSFAGIARRLRRQWKEVQKLPTFRAAVGEVRNSRIHIYSVDISLVADAAQLSQQFGLLTNDALIVAAMQQHGLTNLASGDADFDRVPWITRYAPA